MALESNLEFIALRFEGRGNEPSFDRLLYFNRKKIPRNVYVDYPEESAPDTRVYWNYEGSRHHRMGNGRVHIGAQLMAMGRYDGNLVIEMTASEGEKVRKIPIEVS